MENQKKTENNNTFVFHNKQQLLLCDNGITKYCIKRARTSKKKKLGKRKSKITC